MTTRREFVRNSIVGFGGLSVGSSLLAYRPSSLSYNRPNKNRRKFRSSAIDKVIESAQNSIKDKDLSKLFTNCYPNTIDTTVDWNGSYTRPDTFVITCDIDAMWLRDSTAQVWPYIPYINNDEKLKAMIAGLINRQIKCVHIDPYANSFNKKATGGPWNSDHTDMKPEIHERKWEIDSLCYVIRLSYGYWQESKDDSLFGTKWYEAMKLIVKTFKEQQRIENKGPYSFMRTTPIATDTVPGRGWGNPAKPNGLICSMFRPSDDSTIFPYLIPSNFFAVASLRQLSEMLSAIFKDDAFAEDALELAASVEEAINKYATKDHPEFGTILAYEVDGFGNQLFMDDANIPSLLSLPYLSCIDSSSEIYQNTRRFVLSSNNPYYFEGKAAKGVGSPHTGVDTIWHMSLIMQAMTSTDSNEIKELLETIKETHGGKWFMHESFDKDNASQFSRHWFAWANTLFGELILKVLKDHPDLLS